MGATIYIDGQYVGKNDAKISVYDHGLLYGDGVFEGIRSYGGTIFELQAHVRRLFESARAIRLEIPMNPTRMSDAIEQTFKSSGLSDAYFRVIVTRGIGLLGISPWKASNPSVIIIVDQIELYPPELYEKGLELVTCSTFRNHPGALSPRIKSLNYLNNILAKIEALDAGADEGIMLNHGGQVAECTGDNIFTVYDGTLMTPSTEAGILEGVTRDAVLDLARQAGIPTEERTLMRHDLYIADECFLTGTAAEVIPATKIDGRVIGQGKPGPITRQLMCAFRERTGR